MKKFSGVICDKRIENNVLAKVYKRVVSLAMLYGFEMVSLTKRQGKELEVADYKMYRLSFDVSRMDRIRNEHLIGTAKARQCGA